MKTESLSKEKKLFLTGLNCADCAAEIEEEVNKLAGINQVNLNFSTQKLNLKINSIHQADAILEEVKEVIKKVEPEVKIREEGKDRGEDFFSDNDNLQFELIRLGIGALFFIAALFLRFGIWGKLALYGTAYLVVGAKVLTKSIKNLFKGQIFDENFLMTIATIGSFAIRKFPEGVAVMLFYEIGELLQDRAVNRSRQSIKSLLDIKPDYANLQVKGKIEQVPPNQVKIGDTIVVKPGEKIPLDGKVVTGKSMVDTSALTGESVTRKVEPGEKVLSGFINKKGVLTVEVSSSFGESTVNKILELVENAADKKASTENFITKFARYYTPAVVFSALILAILPPVVIPTAVFSDWVYRALVFLVISCPCALVVSIPLSFFGGIGAASKRGVLVKGGNYLEALNSIQTVVMDKTGTLTEGIFEVTEIVPAARATKGELLEVAAKVESNSNHPIAVSILEAYEGEINNSNLNNYREISGQGVKGNVGKKEVLAGNYKLMESKGIKYNEANQVGTVVHVAVADNYLGYILISDRLKKDAQKAVQGLRDCGSEKIVMLTGDNKMVARSVADKLGLDDWRAELLPQEKVKEVEELLIPGEDDKLVFMGDGINDAPVLARADVGVAMGGLGSDAAIEAADIVLMKDKPSSLVEAIKVAKFTRNIVWQNIALTFLVKGTVLTLGAFGAATMWGAVFADVGVALLAVLNALRITRVKN